MDTPVPPVQAAETARDQVRAARIRWEREKIAKARQQVEAGKFLSGEELDRWLEQSMATDQPVPLPRRKPVEKTG